MSAGPWEVDVTHLDDGDFRIVIVNEEMDIELHFAPCVLLEEDLPDAHRIAERLNRTEGDER